MASTKQRKAKAKRVAHHNRSRRNQAEAVDVHVETGQVYATRGRCSVCGKREKLLKSGNVSAHGLPKRCPGGGHPPTT